MHILSRLLDLVTNNVNMPVLTEMHSYASWLLSEMKDLQSFDALSLGADIVQELNEAQYVYFCVQSWLKLMQN